VTQLNIYFYLEVYIISDYSVVYRNALFKFTYRKARVSPCPGL